MKIEKLIDKQPFKGKSAIICGGSQGIGKATASLFFKLGGNVCLVARTLEKLNAAAEEIRNLNDRSNQFVEVISCDASDFEQVELTFNKYINERGIPDYLFNFIGISFPNYTEKLTFKDFEFHMKTNYFGQLNPILSILPHYIEKKSGYIINMSSVAGYIGLMGYAAYTPTKFAIVGLSEVLRNEYNAYNIRFSVVFPPDTDTPGLHEEIETRPEELNIISERAGLWQPEQVAEMIIKGILKKKFYILSGTPKLYWRLMRFFPGLVHWVTDGDLKKARKKLAKN
jgi:3-dehydrosphinganine reductase